MDSKSGSWTATMSGLPALLSATRTKPNGRFNGHKNNIDIDSFKNLGVTIRVCHFNVESLSRSKSECLGKILHDNEVEVVCLQETHVEDLKSNDRGNIPGYSLVGEVGHRAYGIATYVRNDVIDVTLIHTSCDGNVFLLAVKVSGTTVVNIYKPPNTKWPDSVLPSFQHPVLYVGDFNSHHSSWGYKTNDDNGTGLAEWAENNNLFLVFNIKDPATFHSARWQRGYSPDLCFCSCDRSLRPIAVRRRVLGAFPHSQHRPVVVTVGVQIPLIKSYPRPRWNFCKADWGRFSSKLDDSIRFISPVVGNYSRFTKLVLATASECIPRGYRKEYIPGWSQECEDLFNEFTTTKNPDIADNLLYSLDEARREKWVNTVENLNFTHSSRKAWSVLRKLSSGKHPDADVAAAPDPNSIAKRMVRLSRIERSNSDKFITYNLKDIRSSHQQALEVSSPFTLDELEVAINSVPVGKAAGLDNIFPEFLKHSGLKVRLWLQAFFNNILTDGQLPSAFKRSKIIAVLKPGKEPGRVDSYRPIALLSVIYKLLERLIYNRISPILNDRIPAEQAGFRPGRNCCDQVLSLTSFIENGFDQNKKTSAAFIDLSAAYDTVWRKGLLWKFYNHIPCPSLLRLLNSMLSDRLFQVYLGQKRSQFRHLNNGLPQGSVLAPLLFNIYTSDIPETVSRKFIYADDIALASQHNNIHVTERNLTLDLATLRDYFKSWKLQPNPTKTEVASFHLSNCIANYKLNIDFNGVRLSHNNFPKYLGVSLDRSLTFKAHLQKTAAKVRSRVNIIQHLAGTTWGASAKVLRTSSLSLVYSAAEYCSPVWLNSAHVSEVDTQLNRAMRIISGALMQTPLPWLPVVCNIAPPEIRRKAALKRECSKISSNHSLPIHQDFPPEECRLISRKPPLRLGSQLFKDDFSPAPYWAAQWDGFRGINNRLVGNPAKEISGMNLPRREWTLLNRFRTGVGRCNYWKFKWGQSDTQSCDCGVEQQTMNHIVNDCPLRCLPGGIDSLNNASDEAIRWLNGLDVIL